MRGLEHGVLTLPHPRAATHEPHCACGLGVLVTSLSATAVPLPRSHSFTRLPRTLVQHDHTTRQRYVNEEMLCHDATEVTDAHVPLDRREQLARLEREREEELAANRLKSPKKFSREQAKSRKLSEARDEATAMIAKLESETAKPPPAASNGKRIHKAPSVKVSPAQQAQYDKMAAEALKAKTEAHRQFAIGQDYASEDAAADVFAEEPGPKKEFAIGFDYAGENDIADALSKKRGHITRKPTIIQTPEQAPSGRQSVAASMLAAELAGHTTPARPAQISRQKSVSVAVDGPSVPASELSRPVAQLSRAAWLSGTNVDRQQFEAFVMVGMHGDFLVRKSGSSAGYVLCVNDHGQPVNYSITAEADETLEFLGQRFGTLEAVVSHARRTPLKSRTIPGEKVTLGFPAIRESWFSSSMERGQMEAAVAAGGHGAFAVRMSSTGDKYVLVVNDKGDVCSYSITRAGKRWAFGGSAHSTIEDVVHHIKTMPFQSKNTPTLTLGSPAL
eukprot:m.89419 g.89419  ORF g.89419 m.89419 type:complete len:503 (+) comp11740_c0_seq2:1823-3331(+)